MRREEMIQTLKETTSWDVIIIGGGSTGLWAALDATTRGFKTLLLESGDFACGTSSNSTKLLHGGLSYLKQGHIKMVREAILERERLHKNAPHLASRRSFLIPYYSRWERPYYAMGMQVYDFMSGDLGAESHSYLNSIDCLKACPTLNSENLQGGCRYIDGQFNDSRLAIELAKTIVEYGGCVLNYCEVKSFIKEGGYIEGVGVEDLVENTFHEVIGRVVVNATGIYVDEIRKRDDPNINPIMSLSRGSHIVVDSSHLPGNTAIVVPKTTDKRLVFLIPWLGKVLIGTTDIPVSEPQRSPKPSSEEIDYLLETANRFLAHKLERTDIRSVFTGIRPLICTNQNTKTKKLLRTHKIIESKSGLFSIAGGKWTTGRKMGEDLIDEITGTGRLEKTTCHTQNIGLHETIIHRISDPFTQELSITEEDVRIAAREEMAETLIDILSRRTRSVLLDPRASIKIAPAVASILAEELGRDEAWAEAQVFAYVKYANNYCV